jgi:4-hydroxy-4-methyl-2-oxoglutarate aldolase
VNVDLLIVLGAATLGESGALLMPSRIRPAWPGATVAGPAFTVTCPPGDNLAIHVAVTLAPPGSVLVVDASAEPERGYWGEILTTAAETTGITGLVIDGGVRDIAALSGHGFGAFSDRIALRGATKDQSGEVGGPVTVGDVTVHTGDTVVGDADGVVVIPAEQFDEVVAAARHRSDREQDLFRRLQSGETTVDLLELDPTKIRRVDPSV